MPGSLPIVKTSDFVGKYEIALSTHTTALLDKFITDYEKSYLYQLLGKTLADLYIADLDANKVPAAARYQNIHNYLYDETYQFESFGIKEMLLGFVFYHYVSETQVKHSLGGVTKQQAEASNHASVIDAHAHAERRFNDSVRTSRAIQRYIGLNMGTYPEYKGVEIKSKLSWLL